MCKCEISTLLCGTLICSLKMTASIMTSAALALWLVFLVHSAHSEGAGEGQDGANAPISFVLGPYYECLTNGSLQSTTYTYYYTGRRSVHNVEIFAKGSEEASDHCPQEDWSDRSDEEEL